MPRLFARFKGLLPVLVISVPMAAVMVQRYPASTDFPEHTLAIAVLRGLVLGEPAFVEHYTSNLSTSPYLAYHLLGAALALLFGSAQIANRVLVVLIAIAFPLAFRKLLVAFEADRRLVWFSLMPFFSRALSIGFLPYLFSIPVGLVLLALAVSWSRAREPFEIRTWAARNGALAALGTLLFYSHLSSLTVFVPAALLCSAVVAPRPANASGFSRWCLGALSRSVWVIVPLLLALRFALVGRLSSDIDHPVTSPSYMTISRSLHALPLWIFDNFRHGWDDAAALGYWIAFTVTSVYTVVRVARGRASFSFVRVVPLTVATLGYIVTPFQVGAAVFLNVRLAPLLLLLSLLPLRVPPTRWMTRAVGGISAFAGIVYVVSSIACERIDASGLDAILQAIPPRASVLSLSFERQPHVTYVPAYLYFGSLRASETGGLVAFSFASLPHWSIRYRAPQPKHRPFWVFSPCGFRNSADGRLYDFVIVRGKTDPFVDEPAGPQYSLKAQSGLFALYERHRELPEWEGPDNGPCPHHSPSTPMLEGEGYK